MEYHLEKKIRLNNETEHKSLYPWCLEETDDEGNKLGSDFIPWRYGSHFTASEFRLSQTIEFGELSFFDDEEEEKAEENPEIEESESIRANLHPGICQDGKWLEDDIGFSMFGSDRLITDFALIIYKAEEGNKERCIMTGCPSYTSEIDFVYETINDSVELCIFLSETRFNKLAEMITNKSLDMVRLSLSRVSGFYSEWTPQISTNRIKVLAGGGDQEVIKPEGCEINPPELRDVGKFDLTLFTRTKFNPKQNFKPLNISKLFDDDIFEEEIEAEPPEELTNKLLITVTQNQVEIAKMKTPLWILVILMGVLILSLWF